MPARSPGPRVKDTSRRMGASAYNLVNSCTRSISILPERAAPKGAEIDGGRAVIRSTISVEGSKTESAAMCRVGNDGGRESGIVQTPVTASPCPRSRCPKCSAHQFLAYTCRLDQYKPPGEPLSVVHCTVLGFGPVRPTPSSACGRGAGLPARFGDASDLYVQHCLQPIGSIGGDAVHAQRDQMSHGPWIVHGPGKDEESLAAAYLQ